MKKKYSDMTAAELAAATARFDEPGVMDQSRPLTPGERARWQKLKRKRGRPKTGAGFQRISVSIEKRLLQRVNSFARKHKVSRSQLFAQTVAKYLSAAE